MEKPAESQAPFSVRSAPVMEEMQAEHLDAVLAIERAVFSNPWRLYDFQYALEREGSFCTVALSGRRVMGYSVGFSMLGEFHLADFAVHPELQERGVGRWLLNALLEVLKGRTINIVSLEVRVSNSPAIALYRKAGFQTVSIRRGYYSRPREDALVMLKALKGKFSDWTGGAFPPFSQRHEKP